MTGRRKSRGTVEQRGGAWWLRIPTERVTPATGELSRRRERIPLGDATELRSEIAARREADAWIARQHPEQLTGGEPILAGEYFQRFLAIEAASYRPTTQRRYRSDVRLYLAPELGSLPLARVGPAAIKAMIANLISRGIRRNTILCARGVVLQMLRQAKVDGFDAQDINPRQVRVPKQNAAEREQRHISPDELTRILDASEPPWRALWAVMGLLGLRISEALALTWSHLEIDSLAPLVSIRQSTQGGNLYALKTQTSRSDLPIGDELLAILRDYRACWTPNTAGLLFATRRGEPLRAEDVRWRQWNPLLARLAIAPAGFHALRHGLPRRLFAAGCSASVVRQLMRHGTLRMTERYTHTTADDLRAAMNAATGRNRTAHSWPKMAQDGSQTQQNKGSGNATEC